MESITVLFIALGILWLLQMAMSWRQAKAFLRDTRTLRSHGRVATGMGRRRILRRAYVTLAADDAGRVVAARVLSGVTVFARPRALAGLTGVAVSDLASGRAGTTLPPLFAAAAAQAAGFLVGSPDPAGKRAASRT